ncbi:hypothetical protein [Youngiibacter multivorans]|uniref:Uncharacterized protein n=1 Tax=Youngiibacter multivorans TaxID=937251 RepID=A0ABS4FZJ0_9CLOT|nr:hypothetical protein [Youngiibacter multivorans]MBP1917672.1 hypothetical protein [Youngiibacter multivorans]
MNGLDNETMSIPLSNTVSMSLKLLIPPTRMAGYRIQPGRT